MLKRKGSQEKKEKKKKVKEKEKKKEKEQEKGKKGKRGKVETINIQFRILKFSTFQPNKNLGEIRYFNIGQISGI